MTRTRRGSVDDEEKVVPSPVSTRRTKEVKEATTTIVDSKVVSCPIVLDNESLQKNNLNELKAKATSLSVKFTPSVKKQELIAMLLESLESKTKAVPPLKRSSRSSGINAASTDLRNTAFKAALAEKSEPLKRGSSRINKADASGTNEHVELSTPGKRKAAEMQKSKSPSPEKTSELKEQKASHKQAKEASPLTKSPLAKKETVGASSSIDHSIVKTAKKPLVSKSSSDVMDVEQILTPHESSLVLAALSDPEIRIADTVSYKKAAKSPKGRSGNSTEKVPPREENGGDGIHDLARNVILNYRDGASVSEHEYLALKIFLDNVKPADKPSPIPTPKSFTKTTMADNINNGLRQASATVDSAAKQGATAINSFSMPPPSEIKVSFDSGMKVDKRLSFGDSSWGRHRESFLSSPSPSNTSMRQDSFMRQDYPGAYPSTTRGLNQPMSMSMMHPPIMQTSKTPLSMFNPGSMTNTLNTLGYPLQPPQIAFNNSNISDIGIIDSRKRQPDYFTNDRPVKRQQTMAFSDVRLAFPMPAPSPFINGSFSQSEKNSSRRSTFSDYKLPSDRNPCLIESSPSTLDLLAETSNARKKHLTFIEKRKLQRQSIGQAPPSVAKRILESIVDIKPPSEEMRRKPEAIDLLPSSAVQQQTLMSLGGFEDKSAKIIAPLGSSASHLYGKDVQSSSAPLEKKFEFKIAENVLQPSRPINNFGSSPLVQSVDKEFTFSAPTPIEGSDEIDFSATSSNQNEIKYVFSPPNIRKKATLSSGATPTAAASRVDTRNAFIPVVVTTQKFNFSSSAKPAVETPPVSFSSALDTKTVVALPSESIWAKAAKAETVKCPACMVPNEKSAKKCVSCESDMSGPASTTVPSAAPVVPAWASAASSAASSSMPSWAAAPVTTSKPSTLSSSTVPGVGFVFGASAKSEDIAPATQSAAYGFSVASAPAPIAGAAPTGGFVFGSKPAESSQDKAPLATAAVFGGFASSSGSKAAVPPASTGGFVFDASSDGKTDFSFGGSKGKVEPKVVDSTTKPIFGAFNWAPPASTSSIFSFGAADSKLTEETEAASKPSNKPSNEPVAAGFSFGSSHTSDLPKFASGSNSDEKTTGTTSSAPVFAFGSTSNTASRASSTPVFSFSSAAPASAAPASANALTPSLVFSSVSAPVTLPQLGPPAGTPATTRTLSIGSHGTDSPSSRMDMEHGDGDHNSSALAAPPSLPAFGANALFSSGAAPVSNTFLFTNSASSTPFGSTAPTTNLFGAPLVGSTPAFGSSAPGATPAFVANSVSTLGASSVPGFGPPIVKSTSSFGGPVASSNTFSFGGAQSFSSQANNTSSVPSFSFGAGIPVSSSSGNMFGGTGMFSSGPLNSVDGSGGIGNNLNSFLGGSQSSTISTSTHSTPFNSTGAFDIGKEDPKDRRKVKAKRRT